MGGLVPGQRRFEGDGPVAQQARDLALREQVDERQPGAEQRELLARTGEQLGEPELGGVAAALVTA